MKKLLLFLWTCFALYYPSQAQTFPCNAGFTFQIDGSVVRFYPAATTVNHPQLHYWIFADGTVSTIPNPVHTFPSPGTYSVRHVVKDSLERCSDSAAAVITIQTPTCSIEPKFEWRKDSLNCRKIIFINQSVPISPNVKFTWQFGDGAASNDINPSHTYNQNGSYKVCLVIDGGNNCIKEICKDVVVLCDTLPCNLQAEFRVEKDSAFPNKVHFFSQVNSPAGVVPVYRWNFGDGGSSTEPNPVHTYNQPGTYNVCLRVAISSTCVKEICKSVVVPPVIEPCRVEAKFESRIDSVQHLKVYFINHTVSNQSAIHYAWKFGDGTTSTETHPVHLYQQPGIYEVCLVAETSNGCRSEYCSKVELKQSECTITAKYSWKQDSLNHRKIWFTNLSQPVNAIWRTYWSYGDGTTSQDFNSKHEYAHPGKYQVCLRVVSLNECVAYYCDSVIAGSNDTCIRRSGFRIDSVDHNVFLKKFIPDTINTTWKYYWKFGDGTQSDQIKPEHKYAMAGNYTVCLTVVTSAGCQTTTCKELKIGAVCETMQAVFEVHRDPERPNKIHFIGAGNEVIVKQKWTIRKDSTVNGFPYTVVLTENNPTFIFPFTGKYSVCLEATFINGCVKQYCEMVSIERVVLAPGIISPVSVSPNPARSIARISLKLENPTAVSVTVLDGGGSVKWIQLVNGIRGNNTISLPVDKLSQGQYLVRLVYGNQVRWTKFQKL